MIIIFFRCHIAILHSIKLRASIILALVKLALMSGETLTRKFLVESQEKLAHNFLTYGLRYTLCYCLNLKADWGLCQQKNAENKAFLVAFCDNYRR